MQLADDAWNSCDPARVVLAYTEGSQRRNRCESVVAARPSLHFLEGKRARELDYRLHKELSAFSGNRISVRFEYESREDDDQWWLSHRNEHRPSDESSGLMRRRDASVSDYRIDASERRIAWS